MKKRLLALLLALALTVGVLVSCGCEHVDANDDKACDECGEAFEDGCDKHVDKNDDGKCDNTGCGKAYTDGCDTKDCLDTDNDGKCDNAGCDKATTNKPNTPDTPDEPDDPVTPCTHVDANDNGKCDECDEAYTDGCDTKDCLDTDNDGKCDNEGCDKETSNKPATPCTHVDADDNGKCDECEEAYTDGCDTKDCLDTDNDGKCDNEGCDKETENKPDTPDEPAVSVTEDVWKAAFDFDNVTIKVTQTVEVMGQSQSMSLTLVIADGKYYEVYTEGCVAESYMDAATIDLEFGFANDFAKFTFADGKYTCAEYVFEIPEEAGYSATATDVVITLGADNKVASISYTLAQSIAMDGQTMDVTSDLVANFSKYDTSVLPAIGCGQSPTNDVDADDDGFCDNCGTCVHRDADDDGKCDKEECGVDFTDGPEKVDCTHRDADDDNKCDNCGNTYTDACDIHVDKDDNNKCDKCNTAFEDGKDLEDEIPETPDRTGKEYTWDEVEVILEFNLNSSGNELEALTKRYMAGESGDNERIDTYVMDRNDAAMETTGVYPIYRYIEETEKIGWGAYQNRIATDLATFVSGETPDMYCGFAYDLTMAATLGSFVNLHNTTKGTNYFTFLLDDYRPQYDDEGYLIDFMESITPLPKTKMYLYASNYTLDVIRSMYVIPVSVSLLGQLDVSDLPEGAGDRNEDGIYQINEFYDAVRDVQWTYDMMAKLSGAIFNPTSGLTEANFNDTLGFVLDTSMGLPSAGMTYSTDFFWYNLDIDEEGNYSYEVPETNENLYAMVEAWENLFKADGVIKSNKDKEAAEVGTSGAGMGIRQRFSEDKILFGGVVLVGALDYSQYQNMENGFGIAPIPLYATYQGAEYKTAIHNLARVIGISKATEYFSECTAFLDYQALNSGTVMNQYYRSLQYETVGGEEYNIEILDYLRDHIRSNRDQYLENIMQNAGVGITNTVTDLGKYKWAGFFRGTTAVTAASVRGVYDAAIDVKNTALKELIKMYEALE